MRIEILVGNDDPIIFPLNSSKVTVGSGESCDIVLPASGVSRKHLVISTEGDNYFVADQGSTNGTFMNEERLVPGRRVEFTSFFPVRLGDEVLISLLGDDEGEEIERIEFPSSESSAPKQINQSNNETTRVINLKELNAVKTETLVKKREEKRTDIKKRATAKGAAKAPEKKKPQSKSSRINIMIAVFLAAAAYYNFFVMKPEVEPEVAKVGEVVKVERPQPKKVEAPALLIPVSDLGNAESFQTLINDFKCVTDVEKYFCETIPGASFENGQWGVTQVGTMINVMIEGSRYIDEAKKIITIVPGETEESQKNYENHLKDVTAYIFFLKGIPANLDYSKLTDKNITFALYVMNESDRKFFTALSLKPNAMKEFKTIARPEFYGSLRQPGTDVLALISKYYQVIKN